MTSEEARWILKYNRPDRPRKTDKRQLQQAIDAAIATMEAYENLMKMMLKGEEDDEPCN